MITNEIYFFKNQSSVSISDSLYNVNDGVLILQVDGNASNLELSVLGNTDLIDDDFIALKTINATDYSMSDKITSTGIYWIDINGIRKVKLNLSKITGSVNVKALTKRGLTTDLVARAMAANSQSGGCSLEEVKAITGELDNLSTEDKSNLVNAINEVANYREITELTDETVVLSNLNAGVYKLTTSVKKIQYGTTIYNTAGYMNCIMLVENYRGTKKAYVFTNKTLYYFNGSGSYDRLEIVLSNISLIDKNETISGTKTFSSLPKSSVVPSDDTHLVNKKYVDDAIASAITTSLEASY